MSARTCSVCKRQFVQKRPGGRPQRYCSDECRRAAEAARVANWRAADPDRARRLDRDRARRRSARLKAERPATVSIACAVCGEPFERPTSGRSTFCSRKCRNRRARQQRDPKKRAAERARYRARRKLRNLEEERIFRERWLGRGAIPSRSRPSGSIDR